MYKYGIGDKVKVVKYGHGMWKNDNGEIKGVDMSPELVGKIGLISGQSNTQGQPKYAIEGVPGKHAWYDEEQLEMVNKNPNTL